MNERKGREKKERLESHCRGLATTFSAREGEEGVGGRERAEPRQRTSGHTRTRGCGIVE